MSPRSTLFSRKRLPVALLTAMLITTSAYSSNLVYNASHTQGGAPNGIIQATSTPYWLNGGNPAGFANGDSITFSQTLPVSPNPAVITIPANVAPVSTTINVSGFGVYQFVGAGRISGSFNSLSGVALVKNANTFSSATVSGFVQVGNNSALGTGPLSVSNFGQIDFFFGTGIGGTLNTGNLTLAGSNVGLRVYGATNYSQFGVSGSVTLSSSTVNNFSLDLFYDPVDFVDVLTIILNDGSDAITGGGRLSYDGAVLNQNDTITVNSGGFLQEFRINYAGGSGNDVTLLAIPEPGSVCLLTLGALIGCGSHRLRSKKTQSRC